MGWEQGVRHSSAEPSHLSSCCSPDVPICPSPCTAMLVMVGNSSSTPTAACGGSKMSSLWPPTDSKAVVMKASTDLRERDM